MIGDARKTRSVSSGNIRQIFRREGEHKKTRKPAPQKYMIDLTTLMFYSSFNII